MIHLNMHVFIRLVLAAVILFYYSDISDMDLLKKTKKAKHI